MNVRAEAEQLAPDWMRYVAAPVEVAPRAPVAVAALVVGLAVDQAMWHAVDGVLGTATIVLASLGLLLARRIGNPQAVALIATAPLFGAFLMIRTSDWLLPLDLLIAAGLLGYGASLARGGSGLDITVPNLVMRVLRGAVQGLAAPAFVLRGAFPRRAARLGAAIRGVLLAAPVVIVLLALMMSADAMFASFFDVDLSSTILHMIFISTGAFGMGALLRLASSAPVVEATVTAPKLGATETNVILIALNVLLGTFAAARLIALSQGGQRVLTSKGLTYAEYARNGFFQLAWVAVIVAGTLLALRAVADLRSTVQRRTFVGLAIGVVALTIAVCASAFQRLVLYESAYGLTMLRIFVQMVIVWISVVLVLIGIAVVRHGERRAWLIPASAIAGLSLVFAFNVFNPEAFVARFNVSHAGPDGVDAAYLSQLSDDAVPAIADAVNASDAQLAGMCNDRRPPGGWREYNVARRKAAGALAELCR